MDKRVILQTESLTKRFDQTLAVDAVSIEIRSGEIHGLIGENGSGKSTISSMIAGVYPITSGSIRLDGETYQPHNLLDANDKGVSMIVQEMSTVDDLTVAENIFLGKEAAFKKGVTINRRAMNHRAGKLLEEYGFSGIRADRQISDYTFEQRKLVELVRATYFNPKLLIVDETTTALSYEGRQELFQVMYRLRDQGTGIIIISHDLGEILNLCDRVTVLRDGQHIVTEANKGLTEETLKTYMVGRELTGEYYRPDAVSNCGGEVVYHAEGVNAMDILKDFHLELHKGEILGIGGLTESGIHEAGKVLLGAEKPDKGTIYNDLADRKVVSIHDSLRDGVAYTSKNRDQEGLILSASITDNICAINYGQVSRFGLISKRKEKELANRSAEQMQVKMESVEQSTASLSGGNKQKVVLAKWMARNSDVFILDSPTRGIDVKVKSAIYRLMRDLVAQGKSIIMISEEIMELIGMCDRIIILKDGEVSGEVRRDEGLTEEKIIRYML